MNKTNIEYLGYSWSPIAMCCTPVSESCEHCWHLAMACRMAANPHFPSKVREAYAGGEPVLIPERLDKPLKVKKPAIIGVQFMGDLFHEDVPFEFIAAVFGVMSFCQEHTFIVLTKRLHRRMVRFFNEFHNGDYERNFNWWLNEACLALPDNITKGIRLRPKPDKFPLPNVYLGVTAENQQRADERIPILLQIPAAKRFVSIEPMLGPVDLENHFAYNRFAMDEEQASHMLHWVIAGCESGPGRRPAKIDWFRNLKDQCVGAGVPFFLKQTGGYINGKSTVVKMPYLDDRKWNQRP